MRLKTRSSGPHANLIQVQEQERHLAGAMKSIITNANYSLELRDKTSFNSIIIPEHSYCYSPFILHLTPSTS